jgi:hypothetical protein
MAMGAGALAFSGIAVWKIIKVQRLPGTHVRVPASLPKAEIVEPYRYTYELKKISFPLQGRGKRRTGAAQCSLVLDMPTFEARHWMELNRAKLLTITFDVASRFSFEDFDAPGGLELFKKQLKSSYVAAFGENAPREVVLRDWLTN